MLTILAALTLSGRATATARRKRVSSGWAATGRLRRYGVEKIYHAVTMKFPRGFTDLHTIEQVIRKVLKLAIDNKVKEIAIPGLGTGIGGLDKIVVASIIAKTCQEHHHLINIKIVDKSEEFIEAVNRII